jgi:hypothetical protein
MSLRMRTASLVAACSYLTIATVQSFAMELDEAFENGKTVLPVTTGASDNDFHDRKPSGSDDRKPSGSASESDESDSDELDMSLIQEDAVLGNAYAQSFNPIEYALSIIDGRIKYSENLVEKLSNTNKTTNERIEDHFSLQGVCVGEMGYTVPGGDSAYIDSIVKGHNDLIESYALARSYVEKQKNIKNSDKMTRNLEELYALNLLTIKCLLEYRVDLCRLNPHIADADYEYDEKVFLSVISNMLCKGVVENSRLENLKFYIKHIGQNKETKAWDTVNKIQESLFCAENCSINIKSLFTSIRSVQVF